MKVSWWKSSPKWAATQQNSIYEARISTWPWKAATQVRSQIMSIQATHLPLLGRPGRVKRAIYRSPWQSELVLVKADFYLWSTHTQVFQYQVYKYLAKSRPECLVYFKHHPLHLYTHAHTSVLMLYGQATNAFAYDTLSNSLHMHS